MTASKDTLIPIGYLRECFWYDPGTGKLFWRDRPRSHFTSNKAYKAWLTKCEDEEALTSCAGGRYCHGSLRVNGVVFNLLAHRVAFALMTGSWPVKEVDHEDRNTRNNAWYNLREASRRLNGFNRAFPKNKTGYVGVQPSGRGFSAKIRVGGKKEYLGTFDTEAEAGAAYLARAAEVHP